jgi:hypothetical protein
MSERWIDECEALLKGMQSANKQNRDRLDIINSILLSLSALERSVLGWNSWVRNLYIMSKLDQQELLDMDETLREQVKAILQFDIYTTKKWKEKPADNSDPAPNEPIEHNQVLYA